MDSIINQIEIDQGITLVKQALYILQNPQSSKQDIKYAVILFDESADLFKYNSRCDFDSITQQAIKTGRGLSSSIKTLSEYLSQSLLSYTSSKNICQLLQDILTYRFILHNSEYEGYTSSSGRKFIPFVNRH
jgi:hypothetical protein